VSSTTVLSSTLGDADVASCVEARYRRMRFPEVPGGGIAIVEQTITFSAE